MPDLKPLSYTEHLPYSRILLGFEEAIGTADDSLRLLILKLLTDLAALRGDFFISSTQVIAAPVVKAGRARAYVRRHLLSGFEKATLLEVGGDAGRAEAVVADAGLMPRRVRGRLRAELGIARHPYYAATGRSSNGSVPNSGFSWTGYALFCRGRRIRQAHSSGAFVNGAAAGNLPSASSVSPAVSTTDRHPVSNIDQRRQARQPVVAHYHHLPPTLPRQASRTPRSMTSQSVRPATFLSVIYTSKPHN
jgi:hypothetical protein